MGVTIQEHRCRIGRFLPKISNINSTNILTKKNNESSIKLSLQYLLLLALAILSPFAVAFLQIPSVIHPLESYHHPIFPSVQGIYTPASSNSSLQNLSPGCATSDYLSISIFKFGINLNLNPMALSSFQRISNFTSKYINGNKKNQGIKVAHWNKGNAFLQNKMPEINNIISGLHPHILGISEANLDHNHDQNLVQLEDYTLHTCPTLLNPLLKTSRIVTYTHKSVIAKIRPDLMSDSYSSIWLEVGLPRHKKFLVCQTYREWQLLNQGDDNSSLSVTEQMNRWAVFLDQWERAISTGMEVHTLGDMNINHCNWTDESLPSSNQTHKLKDLISALSSQGYSLRGWSSVSRDPHATGLVKHLQGLIITTQIELTKSLQFRSNTGAACTTCYTLLSDTQDLLKQVLNISEKEATKILTKKNLEQKFKNLAG